MTHTHIAINGFFWDKPTVGVGQYLHGLVEALAALPDLKLTLYIPADATPLPAPTGVTLTKLRSPFAGRSTHMQKVMFEQLSVPAAARLDKADLIHVPYFAPPLSSRVPVVTTIPDLIPLTRSAYRGSLKIRAYTALVRRAAQHSVRIIAISQAVAQQVTTILGRPASSIDVTYLAPDPIYQPTDVSDALRAASEIPAQYVYYVGGYDERKNIPTLLRAYAALPEALRTQYPLVLAGKAAGTNPTLFPDIDGLITQLGIGPTVRRIDVARADNPALYSGATCFVYPSCDEGFGLPPLEAMACGTAVIAARAASIPEVVGDAAHLVDPLDVASWTAALHAVLTDADLRNQLHRSGTERARQFTYGQAAAATRAVYLRALGREGDA